MAKHSLLKMTARLSSKVDARTRSISSSAFERYLRELEGMAEMRAELYGELCYKVKPLAVAKCASHEVGMLIENVVKKKR
jgi:hypothetical protein